jgi:hypothetical protein
MKKLSTLFVIVLLSFMAFGCATMNTVNQMPTEIDTKVKNLQPPSGKSLVYIVRPTSLGKPFAGIISANDEYVGTTQGNMFVYAVLAPGGYKFKVTGQDTDSEVDVTLEANKIYYIKQGVFPAVFKGATSMSLLNNEEGREALKECTLGDKLGKNIAH